MLPAAVGVAISPIPIIAVVLMLVSPRGRLNGPAYLVGRLVGVATAGAMVLLLAGSVGSTDGSEPAGWTNWLKPVLGLGLSVLAVQQWRGARGGTSRQRRGVDGRDRRLHAGEGRGCRIRRLGAEPKNLTLTVAAMAAIGRQPSGRRAGARAGRVRRAGVARRRDPRRDLPSRSETARGRCSLVSRAGWCETTR